MAESKPNSREATSDAEDRDLQWFHMIVFALWALIASHFSFYVAGAKLFLIYLYGWEKVQCEALTIVSISKSEPYVISNGDLVTGHHFIHFVFSIGCWVVLVAAGCGVLHILLPSPQRASE